MGSTDKPATPTPATRKIPASLAPVIAGFASLNNFRVKSYARKLGEATYDPATGKTKPQWTIGSASGGRSFVLSPGDFAVQYDLNPLYSAGADGTGQTIAIVNDSNINIYPCESLPLALRRFRQPSAGHHRRQRSRHRRHQQPLWAQLSLHRCLSCRGVGWRRRAQSHRRPGHRRADTATQIGLFLALEHAIYGNIAPVVSISFGKCEYFLGSQNAFLNNLFEQGAAQGQTILVSTGDSGSAGCDDDTTQYYAINVQQVSGFASTPYNVAVGGTDFYYSAWNQGGGSALDAQIQSYWDLTPSNNTPTVSTKGVIPEQPWNESQYGLNIIDSYQLTGTTSIAAGSGGASNAAVCNASYDSKATAWEPSTATPSRPGRAATRVPSDGVRDIPDVSLFASSGINVSFYPICATDGDCQSLLSGETVRIYGVGGISASAPAFAGIMALVKQKYGRQGQANFVLYPLAAQYPSAFHDVSNGTISVPCNIDTTSFGHTPFECISVSNPITVDDPKLGTEAEGQVGGGTTAQYNATTGYDLATGLGTVDANILVSNWNKITLVPTTVTLTPSQISFQHGTDIKISGSVTGSNPMGDVALMTDRTDRVQQARTIFTLQNGNYNGSLNYLPGGTYNIWGHYGGDSKNGQATRRKPRSQSRPKPAVYCSMPSISQGCLDSE